MKELTKLEIEELCQQLISLRQELTELIEVSKEGTKPVELDQPIGRLSRMDAIQHQQMAAANRKSHQIRLKQVVAAISFHARGEYGSCRRCEEPIAYRRLKARPETPFCLQCQNASERR